MKNTINNVSISVLINGNSTKQFVKDGNCFIIGHQNAEYELLIKNNNYFRTLCIVGIDGINVIDGEQNSKESGGYVIDANSSLHLKGYRLDNNNVAKFKFISKNKSYASEKGKNPQNGIISALIYQEFVEPPKITWIQNNEPCPILPSRPRYPKETPNSPWWGRPYYDGPISTDTTNDCNYLNDVGFGNIMGGAKMRCSYSAGDSSDFESNPSNHFNLGSTFGKKTESKVITTEFKKGTFLGEIEIYYATKDKLKEMGVNITNEQKIVFPVGSKRKYCSVPKDWEG